MKNKNLILTEPDFYQTAYGRRLRGGDRPMYNAELAVFVKEDGSYEVIKDRYGRSDSEIQKIINPEIFDETLLLAIR